MRDRAWVALQRLGYRLRRLERREAEELRRWLEETPNLVHATTIVFVPFVVALVTLLSDRIAELSFLLFPPLASGAYTLFADPEGQFSSVRNFVGGLLVGAVCGWAAILLSVHVIYHVPLTDLEAQPGSAALAVFLTGLVTWALDVELPAAFSTALLAIVSGVSEPAYVFSVGVSALIVAAVFWLWRERIYEQRSRYLYRSTSADDHVLVPFVGENPSAAALFGARLAAAHESGKVVLLDVVEDEDVGRAESNYLGNGEATDGGETAPDLDPAERETAERLAAAMEAEAERLRTVVGVPCEVVVAAASGAVGDTVVDAARQTNSDLVVAPYLGEGGERASYVNALFQSDVDAVAFRPWGDRRHWKRVLVPVRGGGDLSHALVDFASRLVGRTGTMSVCTCIDAESQRRSADRMLSRLVEAIDGRCETRVSRSSVESFLERNDDHYDLVLVGASTDRSAASRFISRPTSERIQDLETDIAVVHRG